MRSQVRSAVLLFAAASLVYLASAPAVPYSHDTTANAQVAVSLLRDGDPVFTAREAPLLFIWAEKRGEASVPVTVQSWTQPAAQGTYGDAYRSGRLVLVAPRYFVVPTTQQRGGEPLFASAFGPAAGLTAVPAALAAAALGAELEDPFVMFRAAGVTAALLTAASVAAVFLAALAFLSARRAALLAALYAFGTCVWTLSSQALWQQTAEIFFLSLGVLCFVRGQGAWTRGALAGLAFAAAAACRPTAAVVALAAAADLAWAHRRALLAYGAAALPVALAVLAYNLYYFGAPLDFGQLAAGAAVAQWKTGSPEVWQTPLWLGAAGLLASPARGLLVYSPFLAAAFVGAALAWRDERYAALRFLGVAVPLLWLPAFAWFDWWGGWTYGYRPIVDSAPLLAVLCIPALAALRRPAAKAAFAAAAGWSLFVQVLGATLYAPDGWNAQRRDGTPANIDLAEHRARLWSFRDWQIGDLIAQLAEGRR
ncbi:MAG TPA: hypothetical protein VF211_01620 [Burkholderiales bacterium]